MPVNSTISLFNQKEPVHNRKIALTDVWTLNTRMVNDLRIQYSFFYEAVINPCSECPVDVTIRDLGNNTIGPSDNQYQKQNTYQIVDTFAWSHGKHNFKFGGQYNHFIYPSYLPIAEQRRLLVFEHTGIHQRSASQPAGPHTSRSGDRHFPGDAERNFCVCSR